MVVTYCTLAAYYNFLFQSMCEYCENYEKNFTGQLFAVSLGDLAGCSDTSLTGSRRPGSGSPSALDKGSLNPKPPLECFLYSPDYLKYY